MFKMDTCIVVYKDEVLEELELTKEQFTDFCILSGTDYNDNIYKCGIVNSLKYIKKYKTIEKFIKNVNKDEKKEIKKQKSFERIEKFKEIRDVFNHKISPMGRFYITDHIDQNDQNDQKFHKKDEEKFEIIKHIPICDDDVDLEKAFDFLEKLNISLHKEIKKAWNLGKELEVELEFVE